jgi:glycosyltransferase involved in cell wall biosynthesis
LGSCANREFSGNMGSNPARICLITPGHAASTPRLVRNADALAEAGYEVHVVAGRNFPPADALDAEIFSRARWSHSLVDYRAAPGATARKLARRLARMLVLIRPFANLAVAARANNSEATRFASAAARAKAHLYLGHCLPGLPAAAFAGRARGVPFGFDAEDFHDAETEASIHDRAESAARRILQSRLLPACVHLTSASPMIGGQFERIYGVKPLTLLNVYPLTDGPPAPIETGPISEQRPARFYWFSQTIGPGRGLEAVVQIMARMSIPAELRLRGFVAQGYMDHLRDVAQRASLARPIVFLSPGSPNEMARLSADADLGLSTEVPYPLNHDICLGNKIFAYLLAGVPVLLSQTKAQSEFAPLLKEAALLCNLDRVEESAGKLDSFFSDSSRVAVARHSAWKLARNRFCWEIERKTLLESVRKCLPSN